MWWGWGGVYLKRKQKVVLGRYTGICVGGMQEYVMGETCRGMRNMQEYVVGYVGDDIHENIEEGYETVSDGEIRWSIYQGETIVEEGENDGESDGERERGGGLGP